MKILVSLYAKSIFSSCALFSREVEKVRQGGLSKNTTSVDKSFLFRCINGRRCLWDCLTSDWLLWLTSWEWFCLCHLFFFLYSLDKFARTVEKNCWISRRRLSRFLKLAPPCLLPCCQWRQYMSASDDGFILTLTQSNMLLLIRWLTSIECFVLLAGCCFDVDRMWCCNVNSLAVSRTAVSALLLSTITQANSNMALCGLFSLLFTI